MLSHDCMASPQLSERSRALDVSLRRSKSLAAADVRALRARALKADGVDGVANIQELTDGLVGHRELTVPFGASSCNPHRVVLCLEVAEHISWRQQVCRECDVVWAR